MTTSSKSKSWRDVLPIHPAADLFPMMTPDELKTLGEDIKKNGLHVPVTLWKEQKHFPLQLLDGRNRLDAIEAIGSTIRVDNIGSDADPQIRLWVCEPNGSTSLPMKITELRGDEGRDPYTFVVSTNVRRRHLTAEQKRELIATLVKASPEKSNRQIAETVKVDHKTVAAVRAEKEATGEIPQLKKTIGKDGKARKPPAMTPAVVAAAKAKATAITHEVQKKFAPEVENALRYVENRRDWSGAFVTNQSEANAAIEQLRHDGVRNHFLAVGPIEPVKIDFTRVHWLILTTPPPPARADWDHVMQCFFVASKAGVPVWMAEQLIGKKTPQQAGMILPREGPQLSPRNSYDDLLNVWARTSDANRARFLKFINTTASAPETKQPDHHPDLPDIPEFLRRSS